MYSLLLTFSEFDSSFRGWSLMRARAGSFTVALEKVLTKKEASSHGKTSQLPQAYSFPNGTPGTARARARHGTARLGTGTIGTAARRAVPDSANVP